jgi:hypothetical protein
MPSRTLLEMTQEILEAMQSDIVDSIDDTSESQAVAHMIQQTYWDLFSLEDFPENWDFFQMTETDSTTPTVMLIPNNIRKVGWVKYNRYTADYTDPQWVEVQFRPLNWFLDTSLGLRTSQDDVQEFSYTFNDTDQPVFVMTNASPQWYTTPDQYTYMFNSYDSATEQYLHADRTMGYGMIEKDFTYADSSVPPLDNRQMSMLFNTAKSQAFVEIKQTQNSVADARARRLMILSQKTKRVAPRVTELSKLPNYGWRGGAGHSTAVRLSLKNGRLLDEF